MRARNLNNVRYCLHISKCVACDVVDFGFAGLDESKKLQLRNCFCKPRSIISVKENYM